MYRQLENSGASFSRDVQLRCFPVIKDAEHGNLRDFAEVPLW
jgi:hypothetical protein